MDWAMEDSIRSTYLTTRGAYRSCRCLWNLPLHRLSEGGEESHVAHYLLFTSCPHDDSAANANVWISRCDAVLFLPNKDGGDPRGGSLNQTRRPALGSQLVKRQHSQGPQEIKWRPVCANVMPHGSTQRVCFSSLSLFFSLPLSMCVLLCVCVGVKVKVDDKQ